MPAFSRNVIYNVAYNNSRKYMLGNRMNEWIREAPTLVFAIVKLCVYCDIQIQIVVNWIKLILFN